MANDESCCELDSLEQCGESRERRLGDAHPVQTLLRGHVLEDARQDAQFELELRSTLA
jgi:hypothetical protein